MIKPITIPNITSSADVLAELLVIEKQLPGADLSQLVVFTRAYHMVLKSMNAASKNGYFKNPQQIEQFTVCFAQYYFNVINDIKKNPTVLTDAWAKVGMLSNSTKVPVSISLLMSANAHINHDLPLALASFLKKSKIDMTIGDFYKIDKLLIKGGWQILSTYDEPNNILNALKRSLKYVYFGPTMAMILIWQVTAWRNYKATRGPHKTKPGYSDRSIKIANRLLTIGNLIG